MTYLLQVSVCWIGFYVIYALFLRRETFFSINRYYLLGTLILGLIIPFVGGLFPANNASVEVYEMMTSISVAEITPTVTVEESLWPSWTTILWGFYILGAGVVLSKFLYGFYRIALIYKGAPKSQKDGYILVESEKLHLPFSFFHWVFISKKMPLPEDIDKVMRHEKLHVTQWHSLDIIFTELCHVFFWFNPILIFYKKAIRQSHEFLADAYVTKDHAKNSYGQLLLRQSTSGLEIALANNFFHSQIKKRIRMMYQEKSKRQAMVKYLAAVPVLAVLLIIFSSNSVKSNQHELKNKVEALIEQRDGTNDGILATQIFETLQNALNEGTSIKEILKVDSELPDVQFTSHQEMLTGVKFPTCYGCDQKTIIDTPPPPLVNFGFKPSTEDPIIVIDGKVVDQSKMRKEQNYTCDRVVVLTTENAIKKYGAIGKNGAVEMYNVEFKEPHPLAAYSSNASTDNFDGRKIIFRNWEGIVPILNKTNGIIVIDAEANEAGNITYVEINKEQTTVSDKSILKQALFAAKGYKIEKADHSSKGTLSFNFDLNEIENQEMNVKGISSPSLTDPIKIFLSASGKAYHNGKALTSEEHIALILKAQKEGTEVILEVESETKSKDVMNALQLAADNGVKVILEESEAEVFVVGHGTPSDVAKKENLLISPPSSQHNTEGEVFKVVEEMPRFPGCEDMVGASSKEKENCAKQKMLEFIYKNLKYPKEARINGIEGITVIQFTIQKDGTIANSKIVRNIGGGCGEESQRVVNSMPNWIAGKQRGKNVNVQYTLPIKYKLQGGDSPMNTIKMTAKQFKSIANLRKILDAGKYDASCDVKSYNLVHIAPKEDPNVRPSKSMSYSSDIKNLVDEATAGDRYFFEDVTFDCDQYKHITGFNVIIIEDKTTVTKVENVVRGKEVLDKTKIVLRNPDSKDPLIVVDGIIHEKGLEEIEAEEIKTMNVVKGEKATRKYGDQGKNGVIEITLKKDSAVFSVDPEVKADKIKINAENGIEPLYIIDGKESDSSIEELSPDDIETIHVWKGEKAKEKYGVKGENGVVEITTKKFTSNKVVIHDEVDQMPFFPNTSDDKSSKKELLNFVYENITYPEEAILNEIEGMTVVQFVISNSGEIISSKIVRSLGWGIDEEVEKLVVRLKNIQEPWIPAIQKGRKVNFKYTLPIKFKLQAAQIEETKTRKLELNNFSISPNPNNGVFSLKYDSESKEMTNIYFYSLNGQLLKKIERQSSSFSGQIDLSDVGAQTIIVNIVQGNLVFTEKLIIQ